MNWFPTATVVGRVMPKEAFYKRLTLSTELKEKFVTDVKRITLSNSLTATTLNLEPGKEVSEILILTVDLKKQEFDGRIVENIARQNPHRLVFLLQYEEKAQLVIYYGKLYVTGWKPLNDLQLLAKGFTLDDVWHGFLEQIALRDNITVHSTCDTIYAKLQKQDAILKLQKEIERLEKLTRSEKQPKKKFELYQQFQDKKRELEGLL
ncbi:hypothetical protein SDC9_171029 [bioreactor metagenome]|uniref:DUF4391 domain-containing protein n=1 Tax=bioreactor metagenome TaxID=1076179 RepID=A0A645GBY7_9ZZZZ